MSGKQYDEKMTRRTLLQGASLSVAGLLGLQRLAQAMVSSSLEPLGECNRVTCHNDTYQHSCNLASDPQGFNCNVEFYCQNFECNLTGKELADFNCHVIFSCPKDTGNAKFECTGVDLFSPDFNCHASQPNGNFTCNPGSRFTCRDFACNPAPNKFVCVSGYVC